MKPCTILACFFAAFGVYLTAVSIFTAIAAVGGFVMVLQFPHENGNWVNVMQFALSLIPLATGILLVVFSRRLGVLVTRWAGVTDSDSIGIQISAVELMMVLFAAIGTYLAITEGSEVVRLLVLLFQVKAGNHVVSESASQRLPDSTYIVAHGICTVAGVILVRKCRQAAHAFVVKSGNA